MWHFAALRRPLAIVVFLPAVANAQGGRITVRGFVRDSVSGQGIVGAEVALASAGPSRVVRTTGAGAFIIQGLVAGDYRLGVQRIGYVATAHVLRLGEDTSVVIVMVPTSGLGLDTVHVRDHVMGIQGVVGASHSLQPITGAKIQVIGAAVDATSDLRGRFFVPLRHPGTFLMRIRQPGYSPFLMSVEITRDHVVETSALLDKAHGSEPRDAEALWHDFGSRVRMRGMESTLVPGTEIQRYGGSLTAAIHGSPSFLTRGLRLGPTTCLFVNGRPEPGWPLDAIPVKEIEAVELYAAGDGGDATHTLEMSWPGSAPCGLNAGEDSLHGAGSASNVAKWAVVWLKPR